MRQKTLFDYVKPKFYDEIGCVDANVGSCLFKAYLINEPKIIFGDNVHRSLPIELLYVRRFYTYNEDMEAEYLIYYDRNDSRVRDVLERFKRGLSYWYRKLCLNRCSVSVNPLESSDPVADALSDIKSQGRNDVIVGAVIGSRSDFLKLKASGFLNRVKTHLLRRDKLISLSEDSMSFGMYILNNAVQLYAKAGGIPWMLANEPLNPLPPADIAVGFALSKVSSEDEGENVYYVASSFAINIAGREVKTIALFTDAFTLDYEMYRTYGLYIPGRVLENVLDMVINTAKHYMNIERLDRVFIYKTTVNNPEEVNTLNDKYDLRWRLVHVGLSGFRKRAYDPNSIEGTVSRGLAIYDSGTNELLLFTTGMIEYKKSKSTVIDKRVVGTPIPLRVNIAMQVTGHERYEDEVLFTAYQLLSLEKIDWETCTNWPKETIIIKYAHRLGELMRYLVSNPKNASSLEPIKGDIRYLM